jgi:hypothetical protein
MKFCIFVAALLGGFQSGSLSPAQQTTTPANKPQVLFSGQPQSADHKPAPDRTADQSHSTTVTNAIRTAVTITAWDLDVHLAPRQRSMEAHARVTLRNSSDAPLEKIALQLSSTLNFETIGLNGKKLAFIQNTLASDADHTGQLHEAAISPLEPLAPQGQLTLDVDYGGTIPLTAQRLTAIGAPDPTAQASDWDRVSEDFIGLRGFGNVVWYPVSSLPVALGDGAQLFTEIGRQKLLDQDATASLRITDEFFSAAPTAAILDGHFVNLEKPAAMPTASFPGIVTCSLPSTRLGFETPSLFLARRTETDGNGLRVLAAETNVSSAQQYVAAADQVQPLVRTWLGDAPAKKPHPPFTVLDLPEPDDAPAETGGLLATPLATSDPENLAPIVVHGLAHSAFYSPRAWLNEGVASLLGTLWIEAHQGRRAAMENLNADRLALALAEPATPGQGTGEDLLHAVSAVYYRTKATYVFWMLRGIAGDSALQSAFQAYDPAQDSTPDYFEHLLEHSSGKDLRWFFDDWVYRDRGLPDLSIAGVYPSPEAHQQVLVAVEIVNDGYAQAEVPLTVKGIDASITDRVLIPAHGRITHRITFQENPTEVDVNDGTVPEVQDSIHEKILTPQ